MDNKMTKEEATIYLLKCLVHDETPEDSIIQQMDLDEVYKFAQFHKITGCLGYVLRNSNVDKKWEDARNNAIYKTIMFDNERKKITDFMDKNGIWYCCLKGVVLQNYYPEYGIREFSDNDILFDKNHQKFLRDFMENIGYKTKNYGVGHHDEYLKDPFFNFEMHNKLFDPLNGDEVCNYYEDTQRFLKKQKNEELVFGKEDFYIYFVAHAFKHFDMGGTGLRTLLDICFYINNERLDYNYISTELSMMGLAEKEFTIRSLSNKIFSHDLQLSENEERMYEIIVSSGVYGTTKNRVEGKLIENHSKMQYVLHRLFPDEKVIATAYPYAYKKKYLYPVMFIHRIIKAVSVSRKRVFREIEVLLLKNK